MSVTVFTRAVITRFLIMPESLIALLDKQDRGSEHLARLYGGPQDLSTLPRSSSQLWQYWSIRHHVSHLAQSAFNPPFTPDGGIFTTIIQKMKQWLGELKFKIVAGKWQNWGSIQSGWSAAHVSPSLLESLSSLGWQEHQCEWETIFPVWQAQDSRVSEATLIVGTIKVTTLPLTCTLCYELTKHPYPICCPQFPSGACSGWMAIPI